MTGWQNAKVPVALDDPHELVPYGWAPGGYFCSACGVCGEPHMDSDKRSSCCQDCAIKRKEKAEMPISGSATPEPKKIEEMFAWVCTEADGGEGIPAMSSALGMMPLIGADKARIMSLRPQAMQIAEELGVPVRLVRFHGREVLEDYPAPAGHA